MGPVDVLLAVRRRWIAGLVGFVLGAVVGVLLAPGVLAGGPVPSASGEIAFRGEFAVIGDDLVDGRAFASEAAARSVLLATSHLITDPVHDTLVEAGVLDSTATEASWSRSVQVAAVPGSSNVLVKASAPDQAQAEIIAGTVMDQLVAYSNTNAEPLPDGSLSFVASVQSAVSPDEIDEDKLSLIALPVVLGLLGASFAIAAVPYLRKSVYDETDVRAIVRRVFDEDVEMIEGSGRPGVGEESVASRLSVLLSRRSGARDEGPAAVLGCGDSSKAPLVAESTAAKLRSEGYEAATLDLDGADGPDNRPASSEVDTFVAEHESRGVFVVLFSARLGEDPWVAGSTVAPGTDIVVVERGLTSRRNLIAGLRALASVRKSPAAIVFLD